jgi:hypothetical protein
MATTKSRPWVTALALALASLAAIVAACSNNDANPEPTTPVYQVGNEAGTTSSEDSGSSSGSSSGSQPEDASPSTIDAPLTQLDGALVLDAAVCTTDAGCWSCTPATTPEFLNQCTGSACSPFSNAQRLPGFDGGLPPLN